MGDVADMMIDGTLCQSCGVYIGSDNGYPTYCRGCQREHDAAEKAARKLANIEKNARQEKAKCPDCGKRVKIVGMEQHRLDAHQQHKVNT